MISSILNIKEHIFSVGYIRKYKILWSRFFIFVKSAIFSFILLISTTDIFSSVNLYFKNIFNEITQELGFKIETIIISGNVNIAQDEIIKTINLAKSKSIFAINLESLQMQLKQNPWVKHVFVERKLPSDIVISIIEKEPIAIWQYDNQINLIDEEGVAIPEFNKAKFGNLIYVIGQDANIYAYDLLKSLNCYSQVLSKVVMAKRFGLRRWSLHLKEGTIVELPEKNIKEALTKLNQLVLKEDVGSMRSIDLRSYDKYYIQYSSKKD
jgi:cell division protein FtsQ